MRKSEETFERMRQSYPNLWSVVFSGGGKADYLKLKVCYLYINIYIYLYNIRNF